MDAGRTRPQSSTRRTKRASPSSTANSTGTSSSASTTTATTTTPHELNAKQRVAVGNELPSTLTKSSQPNVGNALALRLKPAEERALAADAAKVAQLLPKMLCDLGGVHDLKDLGVRPLVASAGSDSLFNCLFGRDSIRMAVDVIDEHPAVAKSTIIALAKLQGTKHNPKSEEEPGRIIHEFRTPEELEKIREFEPNIDNWEFPYYGSVDATLRFVDLVAQTVAKTGPAFLDERVEGKKTVRDAVDAAVGFIESRLNDPRAGGFVFVERSNPKGIQNQILEDSFDSVYFEDGKLHPTTLPYAPVAEQGYAYRALKDAAQLLGGDRGKALDDEAAQLQKRFVAAFWQEDLGTFAQAVGFDDKGNGKPMRTIASSPGQLLGTGILDDLDHERTTMVARLFEPDMLAGAGIRTKSTEAARFRAGGYHNGTVWPTISLEIADGLRRTSEVERARGRTKEADDLIAKAEDLENRAIHACAKFPFFPEFFRGDVDGSIRVNTEVIRDKDRDGIMNTLEQPPQPQGWTATAMLKVLRRRGFGALIDSAAEAQRANPTGSSLSSKGLATEQAAE